MMTNLLLTMFVPYLLAGADPAPKPPEIVYVKFGEIKVNGETYKKDIVIEKGKVKKRFFKLLSVCLAVILVYASFIDSKGFFYFFGVLGYQIHMICDSVTYKGMPN